MDVFLEVLQHTVVYVVIISNSGARELRRLFSSVLYKARRVGELRISTDSALPAPPL